MCTEWIPFEDYTKNIAGAGGFGSYCKDCGRKGAAEARKHAFDCDCRQCVSKANRAMGLKTCPKCHIARPFDEFYRNKYGHLSSYCHTCTSNPTENERISRRCRKHGITLIDFYKMYAEQSGACAACGDEKPASKLDIDHDHSCCAEATSCGECVRQLLCKPCNRALGFIRDSPDRAMALATYLMKFEDVLDLA